MCFMIIITSSRRHLYRALDVKTFEQMKMYQDIKKRIEKNGRKPAGVHRRTIFPGYRLDVEFQAHIQGSD